MISQDVRRNLAGEVEYGEQGTVQPVQLGLLILRVMVSRRIYVRRKRSEIEFRH